MAYGNAIQSLLSTGAQAVGSPPSQGNIGQAPHPNPNATPPPYDVAHDPGWKGIIDVADHAFRNFLNALDPDQREMLRQKLGGATTAPGAAPGATPAPNPMQQLFKPGFGAQPPSTSRQNGTF